MNKPIIGILGNILITESGVFLGIEKSYVNSDYVESVLKGGGVPIILPVSSNEDVIESQIQNIDGLIISGGYDVNPLLYGEEPSQKLGITYPKIDDYYIKAVSIALKLKKPILGICKGMQLLNIVYGGTLYQDLSYNEESFIKHRQDTNPQEGTHTIEVFNESKLYKIVGKSVNGNSFHHQAVKDLGKGLKVSAKAKDGVIEAIESEDDYFVLGVQWHPELMTNNSEIMVKIFKKLVEESNK